MFVGQRFLPQLSHRGHRDLGKKLLAIMVIEFFYHPVTPRLGRWNEPKIDPIQQAESNKWPHSAGMDRTAEKGHFIVHLEIVGNAHALPDRVDSIQNTLSRLGGHRLYTAAVDCRIDGIQAVEPDRAGKITGADQIYLMGLIRQSGG